MDLTAVKKLRRTLTLHFAIIACLTAMLVATGSGSVFMPVFIFFVSVAAFIFVDTLEWFQLGRVGSIVGMLIATAISLVTYVYTAFTVPSESGQLLAIAGLLVYPEAVLFMQQKNLRVFEQLAVFLLLEMIVAALVNDNILFGVLLAPIMLLWVSALFIFSRYSTLVQINPGIETPHPPLIEALLRRFWKSVVGESPAAPVVSSVARLDDVQVSRPWRRISQSVPIGVGAIAFAGFFFYLLPRTASVNYEPSVGIQSRVGLPKTLTIGTVGRLLSNPTPVMRVSFKDYQTKRPYVLREPPYLRARVMDTYGAANRRNWVAYGEWVFGGINDYRRLKGLEDNSELQGLGRDLVTVEFDIKRRFASTMYLVPPAFQLDRKPKVPLQIDPLNMVMEEFDLTKLARGKSLVYHIGSAGFAGNSQLRVTPAILGKASFSQGRNLFNLTQRFADFTIANEYRQNLLDKENVDLGNRFAVAEAIEQHLLSSEFSYTLDLQPPSDPKIDPIEDFLVNQKRGHCQYFASAMLMMLRQSGIASRIVVGYRPTEFNSLGDYFPVKQSDAHAWVEALFEREELRGTELEPWLGNTNLVWVRFDPTPGGDGNILTEQRGQAMDYAEKLWKDYVVEGQKLTSDSTLYDPVSETSQGAYQQFAERLGNLKQNLESGRFFTLTAGIGFEWQLTIFIIGLGCFLVLMWHGLRLLPRLAPRLARRLGIVRQDSAVKQAFYARCLALLERHGFSRENHETLQEFTIRAGSHLVPAHAQAEPSTLSQSAVATEGTRAARKVAAGDASVVRTAANGELAGNEINQSLSLLTRLYYRLRFGPASELNVEESTSVDEALHRLEAITPRAK